MARKKTNTKSNYNLETFTRHLKVEIVGFKHELQTTQHHLAYMIMTNNLDRRQHNLLDGWLYFPYQTLEQHFGRGGFTDVNERLGLFEVTSNWHSGKSTKGYRLSEYADKAFTKYTGKRISGYSKLTYPDGTSMRTLPAAITSQDSKGITSKATKKKDFKSDVPVDVEMLKRLKKRFVAEQEAIDNKVYNMELFFHNHPDMIKKTEDNITSINQILRLAKNNVKSDHVITTYTESDAGRLYANNINLQNITRPIKQAALHGLYDYDFENCHYSIFYQLAQRAGVECEHIKHYLDNKREVRQQLASGLGIPLPAVKQCLIAIIYGATNTKYWKGAITKTIDDPFKTNLFLEYDLVKGIFSDIAEGRKAVLDSWPHKTTRGSFRNAMDKPIKWYKSEKAPKKKEITPERENQILAHLIQGIEAKIMNMVIDMYPDKLRLLQHDGFVTSEPVDRKKITDAIYNETGFIMGMSEDRIHIQHDFLPQQFN